MNENDLEKIIKESFSRIDNADISEPELMAFTDLVRAEKKRIEKRQNKQFAVFIVLAVFIIACVILCMFVSVWIYAILQVIAFAVFACSCIYQKKAGEAQ